MKFSAALLLLTAATGASAFSPSSFGTRRTTALNYGLLHKETGRSALDPAVIKRYESLPFPKDKVLAEYVWVDAVGNTRSKTRTLEASKAKSVDTLPKWNFDGSSTGQAPGDDSEVVLNPCRIFRDPFRPRSDGIDNILVMCDTYTPAGDPLPTNTRAVGESNSSKINLPEFWSFIAHLVSSSIYNDIRNFGCLLLTSFLPRSPMMLLYLQ
jgi:glutamine synthetase